MQANLTIESLRSARLRLFCVAAMILALVFVFAATASADYEQVGNFAQSGEGEQLAQATGMAVNIHGAGGVPAGSVYAVAAERVLRYSATGEFEEAWGWDVASAKNEFQRCGPALKSTCTHHGLAGSGGEEVGHFDQPKGVAVDQATGYVYVFNEHSVGSREKNLVEVFNADGSKLITRFGEAAPFFGATIDESPDKIHAREHSIAVDGSGVAYLSDRTASSPEESRVMVFRPEVPGDYEHYVYAGRASDIGYTKFGVGSQYDPWKVAVDDAGDVYAAQEDSIYEFAPGKPAAPICGYRVEHSDLAALTVNPATGEVFYFAKGKVYRFAACNTETGTFHESQEPITVTPTTISGVQALAVNPSLAWGPLRSAGVLYAADAENHYKLTPKLSGSGDIFAPAEVLSPGVTSESTVDTGAVSATLRAVIDPHGFATRFEFQYLSAAAYEANEPADRFAGAVEVPLGGGEIGSGSNGSVASAISGLAPGTEYRFRIVATSDCEPGGEPCVTVGEPATFSTFPLMSSGLPDGRSYELVSPMEKHGGEVFPAAPSLGSCEECKPPGGLGPRAQYPIRSALDGSALVYEGYPFSPAEGAAVENEYLSTRTGSGWHTTALSSALGEGEPGTGYVAFDGGLTNALIAQGSPVLNAEAPPGYKNLYAQAVSAPGVFSPLLTAAPPDRSAETFKLDYTGHSADFSRQFFAANDALAQATPFAPEPPDPGAAGSDLYEWSEGRLSLLNVLPGNAAVASGAALASVSPNAHAISEDGLRVFWTSGGHLFMRENGEATVEINHGGGFLTSSPDGSEVLLSDGCLYTVATEGCEDLTKGEGGFQGVLGQSDDLSSIYFVDTETLTPSGEENENKEHAEAGKDNLYAWHEGAFRFVAILLPEDNISEASNDWTAAPSKRTAEASSNGRWLAFLSRARLTGYDNVGSACFRNSAGELETTPCLEVFIYDSAAGRLRCASCDPTGEAPVGPSTLRRIEHAPQWSPQPRYLTDAGRLFFDSGDRLSSFDVNGRVEDVYEFEPEGVGGCEREDGCISLISKGTGTGDSNFLAMDGTGANVFFTTRDRLVPSDRDELIDVYDAREGGGFPSEPEPGSRECQGETCQPPPSSAGVHGEPSVSSSFFVGPGNIAPPALLGTPPPVKPRARVLTRAQKLASALKGCRKEKPGKKRSACEKAARKRYGPNAQAKRAAESRKGGK